LRVLIDKALSWGYVLSPLAAPHHRRDGLVFRGPSDKGKRSWPSPDGGRGKRSLTYERSSRRIVGGHLDGLRCWDAPSSRFLL